VIFVDIENDSKEYKIKIRASWRRYSYNSLKLSKLKYTRILRCQSVSRPDRGKGGYPHARFTCGKKAKGKV